MAAAAAHIGLPVEVLYATVDHALAKHQRLLPLNHHAIEMAYRHVKTPGMANSWPFPARDADDERLLVNATDSVALGKLAAGLDIQTYYPISPATDESTRLDSIGMVSLQDGSCYQPRIDRWNTRSPRQRRLPGRRCWSTKLYFDLRAGALPDERSPRLDWHDRSAASPSAITCAVDRRPACRHARIRVTRCLLSTPGMESFRV